MKKILSLLGALTLLIAGATNTSSVAKAEGWTYEDTVTVDSVTLNIKSSNLSQSNPLYQGSLSNIIDNNYETYAWFNGGLHTGDYIELDYGVDTELTSISVDNGKYGFRGNTDPLHGYLQYYDATSGYTKIDGTDLVLGANKFDLSESPITAAKIRIYIDFGTDADGNVIMTDNVWSGICGIEINNLPSVSVDTNRTLQRGSLNYVIDGDDNTYPHFNRVTNPTFELTVDYKVLTEIKNIRILNGSYNAEANDFVRGTVQYSSDNKIYYDLGVLEGKEFIMDLSDKGISAQFIRINDEASYHWLAIREIQINIELDENFKEVSYSGLTYLPEDSTHTVTSGGVQIPYATSLTYISDNDHSTYAWFDWHCELEAYIQIDLRQVIEIYNIALFQGNGYHSADMFSNFTFYTSIDGISWTVAGESNYGANEAVIIDVSTAPIVARYVRVVSNVVNDTGVVIREFTVNYERATPEISFTNPTPFTYDGSTHTPTVVVSSGAEYTIHYEQHSAFLSYDAPAKPGTYAMVVIVSENDIYTATRSSVVFRIRDESYNAIRSLMNSLDTCTDYGRASEVREMYNALSDDMLRETFDETACSENENCTMKEKLEYMEYLDSLYNQTNAEKASVINSNDSKGNILIVAVVSITLLAAYIIVTKSKRNSVK